MPTGMTAVFATMQGEKKEELGDTDGNKTKLQKQSLRKTFFEYTGTSTVLRPRSRAKIVQLSIRGPSSVDHRISC